MINNYLKQIIQLDKTIETDRLKIEKEVEKSEEETKELIQNISKYKGMFSQNQSDTKDILYTLPSYISKDINTVKQELEINGIVPIVVGDGNKVVDQYPSKKTNIVENDKVFLITNSSNIVMPDISNWSRYDVIKLCEFLNIEYNFDGHGYVVDQSIKPGTKLDKNSKLEILLGNLKTN